MQPVSAAPAPVAAPVATGTVTQVVYTDFGGKQPTTDTIRQPQFATRIEGSFHAAIQQASNMVREIGAQHHGPLATFAYRYNDAPNMAVYAAGEGAWNIAKSSESIHLYDRVRAGKVVASSVTKAEGSDLAAIVSWNRWADLRDADTAQSKPLVRIPGIGTVLAG
ncbi:MAG: hypothetical protein JWM25_1176 [Thermoleophilia bacterium]|nr:hypothetical protein [Thermoleophilia bacterium]MCZ4496593.1 hypothetical protein [Thermoleophilia bacterium]